MFKKTIRAVIVDDETGSLAVLRELLQQQKNLQIVAEVSDPLKATAVIMDRRPDLLFMDIQMPVKNGFDILKEISEAGFEPPVIFVTAYDQYVVEAIRHSAFDYLLKPLQKQELHQALFRFSITYSHMDVASSYRDLLRGAKGDQILKLNTQSGFQSFRLDEVFFIQSDWNFTRVYRSSRNYQVVTNNIGSIADRLPVKDFVRIDRDTIVNKRYITRIKMLNRQCVLQKNGEEQVFDVPLSMLTELSRVVKDKDNE